jgi:hypothetical protein
MAIQTEERRLALRASRRPQLELWLVGWLVVFKSLMYLVYSLQIDATSCLRSQEIPFWFSQPVMSPCSHILHYRYKHYLSLFQNSQTDELQDNELWQVQLLTDPGARYISNKW